MKEHKGLELKYRTVKQVYPFGISGEEQEDRSIEVEYSRQELNRRLPLTRGENSSLIR